MNPPDPLKAVSASLVVRLSDGTTVTYSIPEGPELDVALDLSDVVADLPTPGRGVRWHGYDSRTARIVVTATRRHPDAEWPLLTATLTEPTEEGADRG